MIDGTSVAGCGDTRYSNGSCGYRSHGEATGFVWAMDPNEISIMSIPGKKSERIVLSLI